MIQNWFAIHDGLDTAARFTLMTRDRERISANELALLLLCGAVAASATGFIRLGLGIPGNAIILSVIPIASGLALVPRRRSGFIMSAGAIGTAATLGISGLAHFGAGAFTSLCLIGPLMDFALTRARSGWQLYLGLILGGISTNLLALASRGAIKLLGFDLAAMRSFSLWWPRAIITYTLCGAIAGSIGALCFFNLRKRRRRDGVADSPETAVSGKPK